MVQPQCNWVSEGLGETAGKITFITLTLTFTFTFTFTSMYASRSTLFGPLYSCLRFEILTGHMRQRLAPDDIGGDGDTSPHVPSPKEGENSIQTELYHVQSTRPCTLTCAHTSPVCNSIGTPPPQVDGRRYNRAQGRCPLGPTLDP